MQRIPSGIVDQYIYFLMVDATDLKTPETGLSSFTVRRSRNGGASAAFTTPTINETDAANMPGWYELLLDEDTTIDAGDACQVMALHITATGAAPARLLVELFRPPVSSGETLAVSSGALPWNAAWDAEVQSECADALTAYDPPTNAEFEARTLPAANYATAAALATVDGVVDNIVGVTAKLDDTLEDAGGGNWIFTQASLANAPSGPGGSGPSASEIADEVQTRTIAAVSLVNDLDAAVVAAIQSGLASASDLGVIGTKVDDLHKLDGLDPANPMTVTPSSRIAGALQQTISGDGVSSSTVTRTA